VLQLILRGTRLQVVGKKGAWLKLQLRNGSTGWIYHSLALPERDPAIIPLPVLKGSNGTSEPLSAQPNMTKKARSAGEILFSMQNGSEVAQFYPE
jgi:SH3-like domain-containing protein